MHIRLDVFSAAAENCGTASEVDAGQANESFAVQIDAEGGNAKGKVSATSEIRNSLWAKVLH